MGNDVKDFIHFLDNILEYGPTLIGPLMGDRILMSISRKPNFTLSTLGNAHLALSKVRNVYVPCHYLSVSHVACHYKAYFIFRGRWP